MPEANMFSLPHGHIPVISGQAGQKNSRAIESPERRLLAVSYHSPFISSSLKAAHKNLLNCVV